MAEGDAAARKLQDWLWDLPHGLLHFYIDALGRVWRLTMGGVATAEQLASAALGAAVGGSQGLLIACARMLPLPATPPPVVRRMLPSLPLLVGSSGEAEARTGGPAAPSEVQVIGLGAGYTLNVASAEATPEPPSPQFLQAAEEGAELAQEPAFIKKKEEGIGAAGPRAPQTPVVGTGSAYAPYSPERPGLWEAQHAFGERYTGREVEPLGTELQGAEEPGPSATAAGVAVNGPSAAAEGATVVSPRRVRLEAMFRETQDLRARTSETLRKAEQLPGAAEGEATAPGGLEEAPMPRATAAGGAAGITAAAGPPRLERPTPPTPLEPMPAELISGEEGRATTPSLEALPEGSEEGTPHAGAKLTPSLPQESGAAEAAEEGAPAAEARLRGLFVPVPVPMPVPTGGTARMVAPQRASEAGAQPGEAGPGAAAKGAAAAGAGAGFEPGTAALLAGRQGQRVTVQRTVAEEWMEAAEAGPRAVRAAPTGEEEIGAAELAAPLAASQKERILGAGLGATPGAGAELAAEQAAPQLAGEGLAGAPVEEAPAAAAEGPAQKEPAGAVSETVAEEEARPAGEVPAGGLLAAGEEAPAAGGAEPTAAAARELAAAEEHAPEAEVAGAKEKEAAAAAAAEEAVPAAVEKEASLAAAPPTPARPSEAAAAPPGQAAFTLPAAKEAAPKVPPAGSAAAPASPAVAGGPVKKKKKKGRGPFHKVAKEFKKIFFTPPS